MKIKIEPQPSNDELFRQAVEHWLNHIEHGYTEAVLNKALKMSHGDITAAIEFLQTNRCIAQIGNAGFSSPGGIKWDVGGIAASADFMKVYWGSFDNLVMKITLREILEYLKNGRAIQASLF